MKQLTYSIGSRSRTILIVAAVFWWFPSPASGQGFQGFDSSTLTPVSDVAGQWGLKIVVLDVGQADAILVMTPNGDICLIDSGKTNAHGSRIVDYLSSPALNGIGVLKTIDLLYTTHFDQDHIGGMKKITERGVHIRKAFDQGRSEDRSVTTATGRISYYGKYVAAVGDPDGDLVQDADEPSFVRHRMAHGHLERIGLEDNVEIRCVAARGDTEGTANDLALNPATGGTTFNENPGSIALLIRLGEFEFYTAGDQTDDDWKSEPKV